MTKEKSLKQSNNGINFWVGAGLLAVLLSVQLGRDIDRPFYGLHSWGQASGAWMTRTHVKYGLGYTKALNTWAVGDPPTENPKRYLDHPQLGHLLAAVFMLVFGIHEWTIRLINILTSIGILLLFLRILRGLVDQKTVLIAGFFYVLFPLTGYFSLGGWSVLLSFLAFYFYLVIIGALTDSPQ
ncbi:MAG: glycosyltransferase family 39 protein, partial [Planctomycetota bacterium]